MTQDKIHRTYKQVAYVLGGISLIVLVIPFAEYDFLSRVGIILTMNLGFHLFYWILSIAPLSQLIWLKDNAIVKDFAKRAWIIMSYFIIASCLFFAISIIKDVILTQEFYQLTGLTVVSGVVLGALKLNLELRGKK